MIPHKTDISHRGMIKALLLTMGVVAGLAASAVVYQCFPHHDPVRLEAWNKVKPRLNQTDAATKNEVNTSTEEVRKFFAERKQNARSFAADVLGLSGKWAYLKGYFSEGNHERYLQECFERNIFRTEELKSMLESAVSRYVSEVQGRENQLLVSVRADLEGGDIAGPQFVPSLASDAEFRREYDALLQKVLPILQREIGVSVAREVVSFVGSEIAATMLVEIGASLAVEFGISGGILGAGAGSGLATFGVGLVAGILVDMTLDWIIRQAGYDPEGEIAAKVIQSLDDLERVILHGDKESNETYRSANFLARWVPFPSMRQTGREVARSMESSGKVGLTRQLNFINDVRSRMREETLKGLILKGGVE